MPRIARFVRPGIPFHVTQRGNRRCAVFTSDVDRKAYLGWLGEYAALHGLEVLAYSLMSNHVHLVVVPETANSLERVMRPLHMRHAQRINRLRSWSGHLWQGRYFAAALDDEYLWAAIRYVELNPVTAGIVNRAEAYRWSSAAGHCCSRDDHVLTRKSYWTRLLHGVGDWSAWLAQGEKPEQRALIERNTNKGLPCGSREFIAGLCETSGRELEYRPRGRPPKPAA